MRKITLLMVSIFMVGGSSAFAQYQHTGKLNSWTIRRVSQKDAETKTGRSHIQETTVGDGYEALVAAHSRALATLSSDIAEAIRAAAAMPK